MPASRINIRELQAPLKARYQEAPEEATIEMTVKSGASDLADPLHCVIEPEAAAGTSWCAGAHPGVGGGGDVPCSADLLMGALAACQEVTVRMVAAAMGIEVEELEVKATGTVDLRGTLGVTKEAPVGLTGVHCETHITVKDDGRPERAQRLLENAEKYCVVLNTLRSGVEVKSDFSLETT